MKQCVGETVLKTYVHRHVADVPQKKVQPNISRFSYTNVSWSATEERLKAVKGITEPTAVLSESVPKPSRKDRSLQSLGSSELLAVGYFLLFLLILIFFPVYFRGVRGLMKQNILSAAEPKFKYIFFLQFVVSLWLNALIVQECSIA